VTDEPVTLDMPGLLHVHIEDVEFEDPDERAAFEGAKTLFRGRGTSHRITAPLWVHKEFLHRCWALEGGDNLDTSPSERAAYRRYAQRIDAAEQERKRRT
jgi:hypothetical protein